MDRTGFVLAAVCSLLLSFGGSSPAMAETPDLQPGGPYVQPGQIVQGADAISCTSFQCAAECTLNFIFDGSDGHTYVGTAGHCFQNGTAVRFPDGHAIGHVKWRELRDSEDRFEPFPAFDFELIRVDAEDLGLVRAEVKGWPRTPTGLAGPDEVGEGQLLLFSGSIAQTTKTGPLVCDREDLYYAIATVAPTDSGGPVVHDDTGKAYGVLKGRNAFGFCGGAAGHPWGPTMTWLLDRTFPIEGQDVTLTLRTV